MGGSIVDRAINQLSFLMILCRVPLNGLYFHFSSIVMSLDQHHKS